MRIYYVFWIFVFINGIIAVTDRYKNPPSSKKEDGKLFFVNYSSIDRKGVFVNTPFLSGQRIGVGISIVYSTDVLRIDETRKMVLSVTSDLGIWVNHCEINPSARLDPQFDDEGRIWLYALKNLDPGDEITINYNNPNTRFLIKPADNDYIKC